MTTTKMKTLRIRAAAIRNHALLFTLSMTCHSDFLFPQPTTFLSISGLAASAQKTAAAAAAGSGTESMFGAAKGIKPMVEIRRIQAQQQNLVYTEAALFSVLCLVACCMMRKPQGRRYYNDDEEEEATEEESSSKS